MGVVTAAVDMNRRFRFLAPQFQFPPFDCKLNLTLRVNFEKLPSGQAAFIEPMRCRLSHALPEGEEWVYEIKFDGVRALAIKKGREVSLISRNQKNLNSRYPGLVEVIRGLKCDQIVLDGEVVALDQSGRSSFQLLQRINNPGANSGNLFYYAFDLLRLNGKNITGLPLRKRKALLEVALKSASDCIRVSGFLPGGAKTISGKLQGLGLEGIIAKKRNSIYEPALRSGAWVKYKWTHEQEFVIGGYTDPEGSRSFFGSILVGYYDDKQLIFAAKVGTGFNEKSLFSLYKRFQRLRCPTPPFAEISTRRGSSKHGLTPALLRRCHWIDPNLVCQCKFSEWTSDGHLRQPVFLGLREDKNPEDVVKED
jgi:bifunctional non-homologous end joining protein LigD